MTKLTIPKAVKQELQWEIHRAGFNPYLIFPDLTGLAMLLTQERMNKVNFYVRRR